MRFLSFRRLERQTTSRKQPTRCRPCLEGLEDRLAPAVKTWIGGAYVNYCTGQQEGTPWAWENPRNWIGGVPGANDTARFPARFQMGSCGGNPVYAPFDRGPNVYVSTSILGFNMEAGWGGSLWTYDETSTLTGASIWDSGVITGQGLVNAATGVITLSGTEPKYLSGAWLRNAGTIVHAGTGNLDFVYSTLTNEASGLYELRGTGAPTYTGTAGILANSGVVMKSAGAGSANISTTFTNNGAVFVLAGTLALTGDLGQFTNAGLVFLADGTLWMTHSYTQAAGALTYLAAGTLSAPTVSLAADSLFMGAGTINGNVTNAGLLFVGDPGAAGTLRINGNYTQTAVGLMLMELGNFAAGEYDVLDISGTASLQGLIFAERLASFAAAEGDRFHVLRFGARGPGDPLVLPPDVGPDFTLDPLFGVAGLSLVMRRM